MFDLGSVRLHRIVDLDPFRLPLGFLMPGAEIDAIRHARPVLAPHHVDFATAEILLGVQSFLLRTETLTILIDSCVGEHKPRPRRPDWHERSHTGFLERLAAAGAAPEDVDIVLCTHLHADHVGWNTRLENGRWVPTFPNARYLIGRKELAHWQAEESAHPGAHNHGAYADSVLPVVDAGLAEAVEDGCDLAPGMSLRGLPGHSPGQIGLCLDCRGSGQALFCGDAIHSPVQVYEPGWASAFCADRDLAIRTRLDLLEQAAEEETIIVPAHIRHAHGMRIERRGRGYVPLFV